MFKLMRFSTLSIVLKTEVENCTEQGIFWQKRFENYLKGIWFLYWKCKKNEQMAYFYTNMFVFKDIENQFLKRKLYNLRFFLKEGEQILMLKNKFCASKSQFNTV